MNNLFLIKNTRLYAPDDMGMKDVLVSGSKIAMIDDKIDLTGTDVTTWDVEGRIVTPGFIARHVHVIGGGCWEPTALSKISLLYMPRSRD